MARREAYNPLLKSYPDSDKVNAVSIGAETLYTRLIAASDDAGRYYGDAKWVMARLYTARMVAGQVTAKDVESWIAELAAVGLLQRYRINGDAYVELVDVYKTLRKDVKPQVVFPQPLPESVTDTGRARNENVTLDPHQTHTTPDPHQNQTHTTGTPEINPDPVILEIAHSGSKNQKAGVYLLRQSKIDEYAEAYPGVNVLAECRKARQWCIDNPSERPVNIPRFLNNWLSKQQDRRPQGQLFQKNSRRDYSVPSLEQEF
jgi:hypothetical protein